MSICARGLVRCLVAPLRGISAHRFISSKQVAEDPGSGCCKPDLGNICGVKEEKKKKKKVKGEQPAKKTPAECIEYPCCPDPPLKYDEEFKDKLKHKERTKYQQTWRECPPRRVVQKVMCGEPEPEPECTAEKKELPPAPDKECGKQNVKCPKITMPGCRPAMVHKKCKKYPEPSDCVKIKAPYPSFSECVKPKPKPQHPTECHCLEMRGLCEVYTYLRKKGKTKM